LRIEVFLGDMGRRYGGRIPLMCDTLEGLKCRWQALEHVLGGSTGDMPQLARFLAGARVALTGLREHSLRYGDLSVVVSSYNVLPEHLMEPHGADVGQWVLALHDLYVIRRNEESETSAVMFGDRHWNPCRQCGECCIGPAEGPISTSPQDLTLWEALGRDDLLYFTLAGPHEVAHPGRAGRARSLRFEACPFLRFSGPERGFCLVHPVKPRICREYTCSLSSGVSKGDVRRLGGSDPVVACTGLAWPPGRRSF
jgi:Fe-S-cluster containining protein